MPIPEKANSVMLLRPMTTAPAARSRATTTASAVAGAASRRTFEPAVVTSPAMSKRSLIETGRPASGDGTTPSFRSRAEAGAALAVPVVADDQVARDEIHLFPVIVHEGLARMHAGIEAQVTRAGAAPVFLVEESGEHLLPDPVRIAGEFLPAAVEVNL